MKKNIYPLMGRAVLPLLVLSLVSNLAILISPLFMMQVLDRVIPSGNLATLALLGLLALAALSLQALVEAARELSLGRLSRWSEREGTALALAPNATEQNTIIGHVAGFSRFLSGPAINALLSAPFIPIFLLVLWLLHPVFLFLLISLSSLFFLSDRALKALNKTPTQNADNCARQEMETLDRAIAAERDSGIATLARNFRLRFAQIQSIRHKHIDQSEVTSVTQSTIASWIRNIVQISALAVGAWLVTTDALSPGGMIAASIITSKAYMTVEAFLSQIPTIKSARADFKALTELPPAAIEAGITFETPSGELHADNLIVPRGGGAPPRLDRISFELKAGECLAVVGSAGSGKSTLLHALCGTRPAPIGSVFLGESEIGSFTETNLHQTVGYLPQRTFFDVGTLSENISCFVSDPAPDDIITAAKLAGVHGLISALPNGYETDIGREPYLLTAGQMQRVALARAIYTKPKYLFLDEPNALLDAEGERALGQSLLRLKDMGITIVMTVHRSGILVLADKVMQLEHGRIADFGNKSDVLGRLGMGGRQIELPILETSTTDLMDWVASQFTRAGDLAFRQKAQKLSVELLKVACSTCPADTLNFVKFDFRFIDKTHCELRMSDPNQTDDMTEGLAQLKNKLDQNDSNLIHLSQDEARLARLSQQAETMEISSLEDGTTYRIVLMPDEFQKENTNESKVG